MTDLCAACNRWPRARAGAGARIKRRFGSQPNLADKKGSQTSKSAQDLVQKVMETSGGDNAELARKVHERFEKCAPPVLPESGPGIP